MSGFKLTGFLRGGSEIAVAVIVAFGYDSSFRARCFVIRDGYSEAMNMNMWILFRLLYCFLRGLLASLGV